MSRMFFFGYGYTAASLAKTLREEGWEMAGTTRNKDNVNAMWAQGVEPHVWSGEAPLEAPGRIMKNVTHVLHSLPPGPRGDMVLKHHHKLIKSMAPRIKWYGYISTISVYGDTHGEAAAETYEPNPTLRRAKIRLRVEKRHQQLHKKFNLPLHIFRAGAIYGPGRSAIERINKGQRQIIHKENNMSSRIHVDDLAQIVHASITNPNPGSIYNCVDDVPTNMTEPIRYVYDLLGKEKPPVVDYEDVREDLPEKLNSFYTEQRLISNAKIKSELGITLKYPSYKEGYDAMKEMLREESGTD